MNNATKSFFRNKHAIPALVAATGSLASLPAAAIELGELTVHSRLGQPLRASIAYALAPNEQISNYCIAMRPGASLSGLPNVAPATLSVANGVIMLVGKTAVREPMVSAHIVVNCPYSAHISREYMLFVDPANAAYEPQTVTQQVNETAITVAPAAVKVAATSRAPVAKDLGAATRYQVRSGDSLSQIAQRIENRPVGLWPAVNAIFEANPNAFVDNDPNKLKAGSWLTIPSFDGSEPVLTTNNAVPQLSAATAQPIAAEPVAANAASDTTVAAAAERAAPAEPREIAAVDAANDNTADLKPGDVILDDAASTETRIGVETTIIPDTQLEAPASNATQPNVATATVTAKTPATTTTNWLLWLAGGGVAIIVALLAFGRRLRDRVNAEPDELMLDTPRRRISDTDTEEVDAVGVDFDLSDDSPTEENLALDADLFIGTGLEDGDEMEVAQDFGFAATNVVDIDLPFEPDASDVDKENPLNAEETDMLPAMRTDEHSILESEILPDDDSDADDYDMSVIVDATKMPQPDEVTERDLKAIPVSTGDDTLITDNYTISKEVDYEILEQDYEDELTATQALNLEIARAASELADHFDSDKDETTAMPLATVTELDVTAQMPARNDDSADPDATGVNEVLTANMSADDKTAEMPAAEQDDETAEMRVESGKKA